MDQVFLDFFFAQWMLFLTYFRSSCGRFFLIFEIFLLISPLSSFYPLFCWRGLIIWTTQVGPRGSLSFWGGVDYFEGYSLGGGSHVFSIMAAQPSPARQAGLVAVRASSIKKGVGPGQREFAAVRGTFSSTAGLLITAPALPLLVCCPDTRTPGAPGA